MLEWAVLRVHAAVASPTPPASPLPPHHHTTFKRRHDRQPSDHRRSHITRSVGCDACRPTGEAHGIGTAGLGCANSVDTEGLGHEEARSIIAAP